MRRASRRGGWWLGLALAGALGTSCSERPRPPPSSPPLTAGTSSFGGSIGLGGSPGYSLSSCAGAVPPTPLARWSLLDLDATLDVLFGAGTSLLGLRKVRDHGYERELSYAFVEALRQVALDRAKSAVDERQELEVCAEEDDGPTCIAPWLRSWGEKLYRRPLTREQTDAYVVQFTSALRDRSPAEAARNALVSMILSPYFVFRIELSDGKTGQLTSDEIATRLSHFATRRPPSAELRAAAAQGKLQDPAVRLNELRRLWQTAEGKQARALQHLAWLGLDVDSLPDTLSPELRVAMRGQAELLIADVLDNQGGTLLQLLTSAHQPMSPLLAEHYGLDSAPVNGFIDADPALSAGLLSQGLFLSAYPSPPQRGQALLRGLQCVEIPPHPPTLEATWGSGATPRERLTNGTSKAEVCAGCHARTDPLGFALEAFDDQGRVTGFDTSGSVMVDADASPLPVANPSELGRAIATSQAGLDCAARHYLEYALDRALTAPSSFSKSGNHPAPAPVPAPITQDDPDRRWTECLLRDMGNQPFNLTRAAESLVQSDAFSRLAALPQRVAVFDTSVPPLEHALQETRQFRGAFPNPTDQTTLDLYRVALEQLQTIDNSPGTPGAGGEAAGGAGSASAGGEAAGGAGASGASGAASEAGNAPASGGAP